MSCASGSAFWACPHRFQFDGKQTRATAQDASSDTVKMKILSPSGAIAPTGPWSLGAISSEQFVNDSVPNTRGGSQQPLNRRRINEMLSERHVRAPLRRVARDHWTFDAISSTISTLAGVRLDCGRFARLF
jgi:hypothetical protein